VREDIITLGGPGRLSRGDADESIEMLFDEHYPRIVYAALALAGDWDPAERLAREAYLRLWRRWRWIADPEVAPFYLQRTLVNLSRTSSWRAMLERLAPRTNDREREHGAPEHGPQSDPGPVTALRRALAGLPIRQRECVVSRCLIGFSETDTADLLGISVRSVRTQTHQGLRQLRDGLGGRDQRSGSDAEAGSGRLSDEDLQGELRKLWLAEMPAALARRQIDVKRAWREFQALRTRSGTKRRRAIATVSVAAVIGGVFAFPGLSSRHQPSPAPQPVASPTIPVAPRSYPGAVAARMSMSGVTTVVGDAAFAWLVRAIVPPPGLRTSYQLAGINLSTGRIMFRTNLGYGYPAIAAGGGRLWMTTPNGQAGGQIVRIDLTTGKILSSIHLAAGACTHLAFGSGHLFAACRDGRSGGTEFWRINPATEQAFQLTSPVRGFISSLVAAPGTLWYLVNDWRIRGLTNVNGNPQPVSVRDPNYYQTMPGGQGLVYGDGSLWALSGGERLARIDPGTGRVVRRFNYRNFDPARAGGLDFLTAGGGWLWFLDNGYPFSGVLRVSEATGRPAGGVSVAPASCGQVICSEIFYTPGSVWMPTAELLIRIDTSRLPS
jgi:DNA-directed RNA polymerase specialized sigma24 family protein